VSARLKSAVLRSGLTSQEVLPRLGLKLEPAAGVVEALVIDRVEKPLEN